MVQEDIRQKAKKDKGGYSLSRGYRDDIDFFRGVERAMIGKKILV